MGNFIKLLPSIICVIVAAVLLDKQTDGWGWFLLVALLLGGTALDGINKMNRGDDDG